MMNKRLRRELTEGMEALERIGAVDGATMREFRADLLPKPPKYTPRKIQSVRRKYDISQNVLAVLMNVNVSTIQKWEQGQKTPSGMAARLLQLLESKGVQALVPCDL
jgi:putative transcriptional regulator